LLFKKVAAVAAVPRPEDFGLDAVATLLRPGEDGCVYAEDSFYLQFKSASERRVAYKGHEVRWLRDLELPLFVASVHKDEAALSPHAAHNLVFVTLEGWNHEEVPLLLNPRKAPRPKPGVRVVDLGPPLLRWDIHEATRDDFASRAYAVLKPYLAAELRN